MDAAPEGTTAWERQHASKLSLLRLPLPSQGSPVPLVVKAKPGYILPKSMHYAGGTLVWVKVHQHRKNGQ